MNYKTLLIAVPFFCGISHSKAQDSTIIKVSEDAYTFNRSTISPTTSHSTNYGSEVNLYSKLGAGASNSSTGYSITDYARRVYLKFNTSAITALTENINKVYIRLRAFQADGTTGTAPNKTWQSYMTSNGTYVGAAASDTWTETGITWDNQPTITDSINVSYTTSSSIDPNLIKGSAPSTDNGLADSTFYYYIDVTDYVKNNLSTLPTQLSFVLQGYTNPLASGYNTGGRGNNGLQFLSREFVNSASSTVDSLQPSLIVYTEATTPVIFGKLTASLKSKAVGLSWSTLSETNSDKFIVEKSTDGTSFVTIGEVKAAGNSAQSISYYYEDATPSTGKSYYRIKEVDLDGTTVFSDIVSIDYIVKSTASVYPNPVAVGATLSVSLDGSEGKVTLVNASGNVVKTQSIAEGTLSTTISTSGLSKGLYFLIAGQQKLKVIIQ